MKSRLLLPILIAGLGLVLLLVGFSQPVQAEPATGATRNPQQTLSERDLSVRGLSDQMELLATSQLTATAVWWDDGDQADAHFGHAVRSAGDVNGDGYDDVIVGTNSYNQGGYTNAGGAWVYYGSATGLSVTPNFTATLPSMPTNGFFGWAVGTAGDVNGDTYDDIMIAMVNYDNTYTDEGAVFVWYGSETGLGGSHDWMARGNATYAHLGWDLGTAGDVDGDGFDDIIVGAFRYDYNNISHAYVWYGSESGLGDNGIPSNAGWTASAPMNNENGHAFGSRVGTAGDVNGDGYDDVFVGAPRYDNGQTDEGGVFIWYGSETGLGDDGTLANADWSAESNQANAQLSGDPRVFTNCGAGAAGDVNGDGYDDFIAGSHYYNNGETGEGIALLWFGSENGLDPDTTRPTGDPTNTDWMAESNQENAYLGFEFGESGDLNGDGYDDVLVSASIYDITGTVPIINAGAAFIWLGSELGLGENGTPTNADWIAEGDQDQAWLGRSLDWAGDVNKDGLTDIIAGAPYYDHPEVNEGRAYVYHGQPDPITGLSAANDSPTILGDFTTLSATIISGTMVYYTWDLGDGSSLRLGEIISHTYAETGVYTPVVTATNAINTMTDTTTVVIVDETITGLNAVNDSPTLLGETTTLTATINTGSNVSYDWDFGDFSDQVSGSDEVVAHIYSNPGVYTATVTASNSVNYDTTTTVVTVVDESIVGLTATNDSPTLLGETTTVTATIITGSNVSYNWDFGDESMGSGEVITHIYEAVSVYTATVTASNSVTEMTTTTIVSIISPEKYIYLPLIVKRSP